MNEEKTGGKMMRGKNGIDNTSGWIILGQL
jgi:hypothetical protein